MLTEKQQTLHTLHEVGLVPVLRAESIDQAMQLAAAVAEGGVTVLEVTMTVPGAIEVMRRLLKELPQVMLGAGTVLDAETARICICEGMRFIVSPALNVRTIEMCHRYSVPVLPGALMPTEILNAWQAGADVVKVFPASAMGGAKYIRSVKAPLPHIEMIPTGGVSLDTAEEFLEAGVFALGVGSDLLDLRAINEGRRASITDNARKYLRIVQAYRERQSLDHRGAASHQV